MPGSASEGSSKLWGRGEFNAGRGYVAPLSRNGQRAVRMRLPRGFGHSWFRSSWFGQVGFGPEQRAQMPEREACMMWMRFYRGTVIGALALPALLVAATLPAPAQTDAAVNYPSRPIRMIVGFAAGGGNDIFARLVGQKLSELLGHPIVIENRPAAAGRSSAEYVANQPAAG